MYARFLLLAFLVATVAQRDADAASCGGTCALELGTNPKAVQRYVTQASASLSKCLKSGAPGCPTPCPLPDPAASGLSESCGALLQCELGDLAAAATDAWDASGRCVAHSGVKCDVHRFKLASKLA